MCGLVDQLPRKAATIGRTSIGVRLAGRLDRLRSGFALGKPILSHKCSQQRTEEYWQSARRALAREASHRLRV